MTKPIFSLRAGSCAGSAGAPISSASVIPRAALSSILPRAANQVVALQITRPDGQVESSQVLTDESGSGRVDWDSLPGMETEARLSQLCRWVLDAHRSGLSYGLVLPGFAATQDFGPFFGFVKGAPAAAELIARRLV